MPCAVFRRSKEARAAAPSLQAGKPNQGQEGQARDGKGRQGRAGQGKAGQGRAGQGREGKGREGKTFGVKLMRGQVLYWAAHV